MVSNINTLNRRVRGYLIIVLSLLFVAAWVWFQTGSQRLNAQVSYDPYADSVAETAAQVNDPSNAVGAPNGTSASMAGAGASLTLDMGSGEEGTQTLKVYFGQINVQLNITVDFLDANKAVIVSESRQLGVDVNPSTQNFAYSWTNFGKAYRFVRLASAAGGSVNIDAVEALGYVGSTESQDTDGDGTSDRAEQTAGTDPLNSSSKPNPAAGGGGGGASGQVNPPPKTNNDKDADSIADDWERANGLDPNDKEDAAKDPDNDGLTNLDEFKLNSNPQKADSDGDGMPDKWEFDHGTDVNKYDAEADPDGDHLTNLGEYKNGTDPQKADDLRQVFCKDDDGAATGQKTTSKPWGLLFLKFLLGVVVGSGATLYLTKRKKGGSKPATEAQSKDQN